MLRNLNQQFDQQSPSYSAQGSTAGFDLLRLALGLGDQESPFPWQVELLKRFENGSDVGVLDIPTGLGKTSVMAIWLVARTLGARLPRRLAYVVDRRAVVDQATDVALGLRAFVEENQAIKEQLRLNGRPLPISTLRGQHVDNREWLADPTLPAIIVGTVDMVGSRLLFEGYGISRKMRPYHAGMLGADTLVVLDEAHLVSPFEKLLEAIADGAEQFGPRGKAARALIPSFKLLSLSATGRASNRPSLGLSANDFDHPIVDRRLWAQKRISLKPMKDDEKLPVVLATEAWGLAGSGRRSDRIIIFCDKRKDAESVKAEIEQIAKGDVKIGRPAVEIEPLELFVGGRRVFEREQAAKKLKSLGFIGGYQAQSTKARFLIATSAGEVGVDLDADHMVSDLVTWERMIQRLGRVNRRGGEARVADVIVVVAAEPKPEKYVAEALKKPAGERDEKQAKAITKFEAALEAARALRKPFEQLPTVDDGDERRGGSPGALRDLKLKAANEPILAALLHAATSPTPLHPALTRAVVDAWSLTALKEHTGRPDIDPWLRGWLDDDAPQTTVVWRTYLPVRSNAKMTNKDEKAVESFFEAAPPHASEQLETETMNVVEWLTTRSKAQRKLSTKDDADNDGGAIFREKEVAAILLSPSGDFRRCFTLEQLDVSGDGKKELIRNLAGCTLIVDARLAGLKDDGLLDATEKSPPDTIDDGSDRLRPVDEKDGKPVVRFRVRRVDADQETAPPRGSQEWRQRFRFVTATNDDDEATNSLVVEKWKDDSSTEDDRAVGHAQLLGDHQTLAERRARELAQRLKLPGAYEKVLAIAARLHDEGKRSPLWQRAFSALRGRGDYAKTAGPLNVSLLDGYRHEFGSLKVAMADSELLALTADQQDLALHMIAAHHGFARPVIGTSGCEVEPPSVLEDRARDVALRFARLQKQWGPWGLAWWESLMRAVDQQASRENEIKSGSVVGEVP